MPKLADIWRLGEIGSLEPRSPISRLYASLKRLERTLRLIHLAVESPVLTLDVTPAPADFPLDTARLYAADSGAGDANVYSRNEAGLVERLTGLVAYVASDFGAASSTTLAAVPGLSINVEPESVYALYARLPYDCGAGGTRYALSGSCTLVLAQYHTTNRDDATGVIAEVTRHTALDDAATESTLVAGVVEIEGLVAVDAGGALLVQFAQSVSDAAASTLLAGGFMVMRKVG